MYEELCAQNKGLVIWLARRYAGLCALDRAVSVEDLVQAGFIGLVLAQRTYDPAGGKTWASWATWYIRHEFRRALGLREGRFTRAHTGADTLDRRLAGGGGEALVDALPDDSLPEADAALLRRELRREVRDAVARLRSDDQREAIRLVRLEGRSYRQAAADMGITPVQAQRLCARGGEHLARDARLRALADLDGRTRFHAHKGVAQFNRDWTSVTEAAALWRVEEREKASM